jgi:hypothetical protein
VYECYIDDRTTRNHTAHHLACCTAYMMHEEDRASFNRRWRNLLVKHGLTHLHLQGWRDLSRRQSWDSSHQQAVLAEFVDAARTSDAVSFAIAVDARVYATLKPKRRQPFGTATNFCFQRVMRVVLDKLEAAHEVQPIAVILAKEPAKFDDQASLMQSVLKRDSRAATMVTSIQFSNPNTYCQLQATHLLDCITLKDLADGYGGKIQMPEWLKALHELPPPSSKHVHEFWDAAYTDRYFASIEWDAKEPNPRQHA